MPFQITKEDVERNDWDKEDVGRWAYLVQGCVMFCNTEQEARDGYNRLKTDKTKEMDLFYE